MKCTGSASTAAIARGEQFVCIFCTSTSVYINSGVLSQQSFELWSPFLKDFFVLNESFPYCDVVYCLYGFLTGSLFLNKFFRTVLLYIYIQNVLDVVHTYIRILSKSLHTLRRILFCVSSYKSFYSLL
jgi:hypothetical protein